MHSEKIRILSMVREGKVTVEEGVQLLDALEQSRSSNIQSKARFIRVRVIEEGKEKVKVNIPVQLARVAMRFIPKEKLGDDNSLMKDIDLNELLTAIEAGAEGKIIDVEDGENRIEVTVE